MSQRLARKNFCVIFTRMNSPASLCSYFIYLLKIIETRKIKELIIIIEGPAGRAVNLKIRIPKKEDIAPKNVAKLVY